MGKKTLYHPVDVALIRHCLTTNNVITGKFQQTKHDPLGNSAIYDVTIKEFPDWLVQEDILTPREVLETVQKALNRNEVGWGWCGRCLCVVWRNNHWSARIHVSLLEASKS